jgi:hypothetical protein
VLKDFELWRDIFYMAETVYVEDKNFFICKKRLDASDISMYIEVKLDKERPEDLITMTVKSEHFDTKIILTPAEVGDYEEDTMLFQITSNAALFIDREARVEYELNDCSEAQIMEKIGHYRLLSTPSLGTA